jgi:hypothetical protein
VVAEMSMEQLLAKSQAMQAELEAYHAEANARCQALQALQAALDGDIEIDSESESTAASDAGEVAGDPRSRRKSDKVRAKKKFADQVRKTCSKFAKPARE